MANDKDPPIGKGEFWGKVAAGAFALWALMIPMGVGILRESLEEMRTSAQRIAEDNNRFYNEFKTYVLQTERRVTVAEERMLQYSRHLEHLDHRVDAMEQRQRGERAQPR